MSNKKINYNLPVGYSLLQTTLKSKTFINDPIKFITKSMETFSGTYSATLGYNKKIILTQNPIFVNHILKENHRNYHKSELATKQVAEFMGKGLLFSNGEYWMKQRRLIQPAFHKEKLQGLFSIICKTIEDFLENFPQGNNIDVYPIIHQLSFNIIINSLFDIKLSAAIMKELNESITEIQDFLIKDINQPLRKLIYPINGAKKIQLKKAKKLREVFITIIEERKASNKEYNDLLDMLLNSKYEDTGLAMTTQQIVNEVLVLIIAGHETTANTLSWLLYLVASHKEVLQKLNNAINNTTINEWLHNEYLMATINETMRLYPAAWMTDRVALVDDVIEGFSFPKNTIIIPFFFGLHRNKNNWSNALDFNPQRFIDDPKLAKSKNFFPFGAGPRMCIGNNFAMAEMSFFIYLFFKKFNIYTTKQVPNMKALITLKPDKVILKIEKK